MVDKDDGSEYEPAGSLRQTHTQGAWCEIPFVQRGDNRDMYIQLTLIRKKRHFTFQWRTTFASGLKGLLRDSLVTTFY